MCSLHGRVALRDTAVLDSTWHGVPGRGASSAARRPKPSPALASDASVETLLNLGLVADTGKSPLTSRSYRPQSLPYFFGMVKNSEPSHKCHGDKGMTALPSD